MSLSMRQRIQLQFIARILVALAATYILIVPLVSELMAFADRTAPTSALDRLSLPNAILVRLMEVFMSGWFFVLGATIGSFLNVVVFRLPQGISLIAQRSKCPACQYPIAARDNIPIVGWLKLKGRCRNCEAAIPIRYPVVEFCTGAIFLVLYFVELISGGTNIPVRSPNHYSGVVWIIFYTKWDLIALYLFHCFSLCSLLSWSLIQYDRKHVPARSVLVCLMIVLAAIAVWPPLMPVGSSWTPAGIPSQVLAMSASLTAAAIGLILGLLLGLLSIPALRCFRAWQCGSQKNAESNLVESDNRETTRMSVACLGSLMIVGSTFGWQALLTVAIASLVLQAGAYTASRRYSFLIRCPFIGWLFVATFLHLLFWRQIYGVLSV